jgi:hypothetical protein
MRKGKYKHLKQRIQNKWTGHFGRIVGAKPYFKTSWSLKVLWEHDGKTSEHWPQNLWKNNDPVADDYAPYYGSITDRATALLERAKTDQFIWKRGHRTVWIEGKDEIAFSRILYRTAWITFWSGPTFVIKAASDDELRAKLTEKLEQLTVKEAA